MGYAIDVYGHINRHLRTYGDDEILRFARNDHFLEDRAMRWRGYNDTRPRRWIPGKKDNDTGSIP